MKGTSKVIFGATLVMVVSLAMVLGLVLVLLAELYCSLLLRRRKHKITKNATTAAVASTSHAQENPVPSPLSSFYSQGVLDAPRSYLFPKLPSKREQLVDDIEKQKSCKFHHFLNIRPQEHSSTPHQIGTVSSSSSSPSPTFITISKPRPSTAVLDKELREESQQDSATAIASHDQVCYGTTTASISKEIFVYISNPIYDNEAGTRRTSSRADTPFETPDTSPSRLESGGSGSSGDDDDNGAEEKELRAKNGVSSSNDASSSTMTPPLTPMNVIPAKACSVELKDISRSLGTSAGSEISITNSQNCASSSSSVSPCTSPSW